MLVFLVLLQHYRCALTYIIIYQKILTLSEPRDLALALLVLIRVQLSLHLYIAPRSDTAAGKKKQMREDDTTLLLALLG